MTIRRWIYREDDPPIVVANRLTLDDADHTFAMHTRVYSHHGNLEHLAEGTWTRQSGIYTFAVVSSNDVLLRRGTRIDAVEDDAGCLMIQSRRFTPEPGPDN